MRAATVARLAAHIGQGGNRVVTVTPLLVTRTLWIDPVPVVNGMITAPERPGHGLAFKPEILRDCAVKD